MPPTKTNLNASESESSRPRNVSTQKKSKPYKQRKIPKALDNVPLCIYGAKFEDFINGDTTIKHPAVCESLVPSSLHVANPQGTVNLASCSPPLNFDHCQIPASTRVYRGTELSHAPIPFQYHDGPKFNSQAEDNILSLTNNPCQSCGRFDPPSSSTSILSMDYDIDPYQLEQLLDNNTQHFIDGFIVQPTLPYVSNAFSGNSYDISTEITGSSDSHLTMTTANDGTTLPFPNYDSNNGYYM